MEKGRVSIKRSMASGSSKFIPWAASSASWIFARTARLPIGAGSEPRVPQKRINIATQVLPIQPVFCRARLDGSGQGRDCFGSGLENLHDERETADCENLLDHRCESGDREAAVGRFRLFGSH